MTADAAKLRSRPVAGAAAPGVTPLLVAPAPTPATLAGGAQLRVAVPFEGMNDLDNGPAVGGCTPPRPCVEPPDPWVAVGPSHVVQMVNNMVRISDRNGTALQTRTLADFFANNDGVYSGDGRVVYDPVRKRFVASTMTAECFGGRLVLAVSVNSNPTAGFHVFVIDFPGMFMDYPGLGFSSDKIVLSANQYQLAPNGSCGIGRYMGASLHIIDWGQAITDVTDLAVAETAPDVGLSSWRPAANLTPGASVRAVVGIIPPTGPLHVGYASISGTVAAETVAVTTPLDLTDAGKASAFLRPPAPRQPGSPATIVDAADERPTDALWQGTSIYTVSTHRCRPALDTADRACVRVIQYEPGTSTVKQDFLLGYAQHSFYSAGIGLTGNGRLHVVFTRSAPSMYPSVWGTWRAPTDPANQVHSPAQLVPGRGTYAGTRWGDYVGVATDPIDPSTVFQVNQYSDPSGGWASRAMRLSGQSGVPSGTVLINGGAPGTNSPIVSLNITWPASAPVTQVRISNAPGLTGAQMTKGRTFPIGKTFTWDMSETYTGGSAAQGTRRVYAQFGDGAGVWSTPVSDAIILDTASPSAPATAPLLELIVPSDVIPPDPGGFPPAGTIARRLVWGGSTDVGSGLDHYELQGKSGDAIEWTPIPLTGPLVTQFEEPSTRTSVLIHYANERVRAVDKAGNTSPWVVTPVQQIQKDGASGGTWSPVSQNGIPHWTQCDVPDQNVTFCRIMLKPDADGATVTYSPSAANVVALSFETVLCPDCGTVEIQIDGGAPTTVDTYADSMQVGKVVWQQTFGTPGAHSITLTAAGPAPTRTGSKVYITSWIVVSRS